MKNLINKIYLKEKIGVPEFFTGRKKELKELIQWTEKITNELSRSTAILSRRKTGKSAIMQRLYNIIFHKNSKVIPFYYEIEERKKWVVSFCEDFFLQFIYQYIAFKTRRKDYINTPEKSIENALVIVEKEGIDYLTGIIKNVKNRIKQENIDMLVNLVIDGPRMIASINNESIVQLIDEFQFLNRYIYRDKNCKDLFEEFVGSYFHTVEYKNAPVLMSGSWVGWIMDDISRLLPGRVVRKFLDPMPEPEAFEMVLKYSHLEHLPINEEIAWMIAKLSEGNPFYISAILRSTYPEKDFTNKNGLLKTVEFEVENPRGDINVGWMEYIDSALHRINDTNAKKIVLYLSKHRDKEMTRAQIMNGLNLDINEQVLDKKLEALVKSDIIERGSRNYYYRGVQDNIFDKVFRSMYAADIKDFDPAEIKNEYEKMYNNLKKEYHRLSGENNQLKGKFAEYLIIEHLMHRALKKNKNFKSTIQNLPKDFDFTVYETVWSYCASPVYNKNTEIDIFARTHSENYSIIGEVKNRESAKFSEQEALEFKRKANMLIETEKINKSVLIVFSRSGFTNRGIEFFKANNMAWSDHGQWFTRKSD